MKITRETTDEFYLSGDNTGFAMLSHKKCGQWLRVKEETFGELTVTEILDAIANHHC